LSIFKGLDQYITTRGRTSGLCSGIRVISFTIESLKMLMPSAEFLIDVLPPINIKK
jgi:hypothetical protein